jgi:hypothetical protein
MTSKKLLLLTCILIASITLPACKKGEKKAAGGNLTVEISTDKSSYKVSDDIKLKLRLTNTGKEPVELPVKDILSFSGFIKIGCVTDGKVTYASAFIAKDSSELYVNNSALIDIKAGETLEKYIFLKISPIIRLTIIPYDTKKIFIEFKITEEDYPVGTQVLFNRIIGDFKSNEVNITIDKSIRHLKSSQYLELDHSVRFFRLKVKNTDQFVTNLFRFSKEDELTRDVLGEVYKYVKVFWTRSGKPVLFEFYQENKLMAYGRLLYNEKNDYSDFIMYFKNGQVDIRYEAVREDKRTVRWDKYTVDFLKNTDVFIGYIKITLSDENISYVSQLLLEFGENMFKRFDYNADGRLINKEEAPPPAGTQMRKRKF